MKISSSLLLTPARCKEIVFTTAAIFAGKLFAALFAHGINAGTLTSLLIAFSAILSGLIVLRIKTDGQHAHIHARQRIGNFMVVSIASFGIWSLMYAFNPSCAQANCESPASLIVSAAAMLIMGTACVGLLSAVSRKVEFQIERESTQAQVAGLLSKLQSACAEANR